MKTSIILDKRYKSKDGYPVKLSMIHRGKQFYLPLGVFIGETQWDEMNRMVVRHPKAVHYNHLINFLWARADEVLLSLQLMGTLDDIMPDVLRDMMLKKMGLKPEDEAESPQSKDAGKKKGEFEKKWFDFMYTRRTDGTKTMYLRTWRVMNEFDPEMPVHSFADIDKDWLQRFDKWLDKTHSQNGKCIHYRNIRAVFNDAIDDGLTESYPFRRFKIKTEETRHRNLTVDELRSLINAPQTSKNLRNERQYIDLFTLSFLLLGINLVDMRDMKIVRGRVEYRRAKTHKLYDIKLEPEAAAIIERYAGGKHVVNIFDKFSDYHQLNRQINRGIGAVGRPTGPQSKVLGEGPFYGVTYYWARHTWASIASEIDIPYDVIAHALGHGTRTVTDVYINFDKRKVDDANRKVIDYVYYGKDWRDKR